MRVIDRMTNMVLRRVWTGSFRTKPCRHLDHVEPVQPSAEVCEACVEMGDTWPALRMCLTCGYVGCCDKAKNRHAMKHFEATGHPLWQPFHERGMNWVWCRVDKTLLDSV
jgi:uncharacterized UBP type Zn finger protein